MSEKVTFSEMLPVITEQLQKGGEVRFSPNGTSMLPLLRQGIDEVVITKYSGGLRKYDIPFYRRKNGQFVLHRLVKISKSGEYFMCGDHQSELESGITDENIIGVVNRIHRGNKVIKSGSLPFYLWAILGPRYIRLYRKYTQIRKKLRRK